VSVSLDQSVESVRAAVAARMAATPADDPKMVGYKLDQGDPEPTETYAEWTPAFRGDSLLKADVHPTSQAFYDLCDAMKEMHRRKSSDYGCPSGTDPLANIRNGAKFVGIPSWKGAMVRLSDKVTRLAAYNATGRLENESLEDNLFDLAAYSLLALLLHREEHGK